MRIINVAALSKPFSSSAHVTSDLEKQEQNESEVVHSTVSEVTGVRKIANRFERSPLRDAGSPSIASMIRHKSAPRSQNVMDDDTKGNLHVDNSKQRHNNIAIENSLTYSSPKTPFSSSSMPPSDGLTRLHQPLASDATKRMSPNSLSSYNHGNTSNRSQHISAVDASKSSNIVVGRKNQGSPWSAVDGKDPPNHIKSPTNIVSSLSSLAVDERIKDNAGSSPLIHTEDETNKASTTPLSLDEADAIIRPKKPSDYKGSSSVSSATQKKLDINLRIPSLQLESIDNTNINRKYETKPMIDSTKFTSRESIVIPSAFDSSSLSSEDKTMGRKTHAHWKKTVRSESTVVYRDEDNALSKHPSLFETNPRFSTNISHPNKTEVSVKVPSPSTDSSKVSHNSSSWNLKEKNSSQPLTISSSSIDKVESSNSGTFPKTKKKSDGSSQTMNSPSTTPHSKDNDSNPTPKSYYSSSNQSHLGSIRLSSKAAVDIGVPTLSNDESQNYPIADIREGRAPAADFNKTPQYMDYRKKSNNNSLVSSTTVRDEYTGQMMNAETKKLLPNNGSEYSKVPKKSSSLNGSPLHMATANQPGNNFISKEVIMQSDKSDFQSSSQSSKNAKLSSKWESRGSRPNAVKQPSSDKKAEESKSFTNHASWKKSDIQTHNGESPLHFGDSYSEVTKTNETVVDELFPLNHTLIDPHASHQEGLSPDSISSGTRFNNTNEVMQILEPATVITNVCSNLTTAHDSNKSATDHHIHKPMSLELPSLSPVSKMASVKKSYSMDLSQHSNLDSLSIFSGHTELLIMSSAVSTAAHDVSDKLINNYQQIEGKRKIGNVVTPDSLDGKSPLMHMQLRSKSPVADAAVHFEVNFDENPSLYQSMSLDSSSKQPKLATKTGVSAGDEILQNEVCHHEDTSLNVSKSSNLKQPHSAEEIFKDPHIAIVLSITTVQSSTFDNGGSSLSFDDVSQLMISEASILPNEVFPPSQSDHHRCIDRSQSRQNDHVKVEITDTSVNDTEVEHRSSSPSRFSVKSKVAKFEGESTSSSTTMTPTRNGLSNISTSLHRSPSRVPFNIPNLHLDLASSSWRDFRLHILQLANRPEWIMPALTRFHPENGASPLHTAVWKSPTALTLMLIQLLSLVDESLEVFSSRDRDGNTAFHLVCANLVVTKESTTPLDLSAFEALLKHSYHLCGVKNTHGDTPLHLLVSSIAARSEIPSVQEEIRRAADLLLSSSTDRTELLRARDQSGATPLHSAISSGANKSIILHLINLDPETAEVEDNRGLIPLHYAAALSRAISPSIIKALINAYQKGIHHKSSQSGDIPIHIAISNFSASTQSSTRNAETNLEEIFTYLMGPSVSLSEGSIEQLESALLTANEDKVRLTFRPSSSILLSDLLS